MGSRRCRPWRDRPDDRRSIKIAEIPAYEKGERPLFAGNLYADLSETALYYCWSSGW
jgi:hypothetical protein